VAEDPLAPWINLGVEKCSKSKPSGGEGKSPDSGAEVDMGELMFFVCLIRVHPGWELRLLPPGGSDPERASSSLAFCLTKNAGKLQGVADEDFNADIKRLWARFDRTGPARGRPLKVGARKERFCFRLSENELYRVQAAARHGKESPSEWARRIILLATEREIGELHEGRPLGEEDKSEGLQQF
jgi:hypothetical protein